MNLVYLMETLIRRGIRFLVSPEAAKHLEYTDIGWPEGDADYREDVERRFEVARASGA